MKARFRKFRFHFRQPAETSRGTYITRDSWFLFIEDRDITGIGECAPLPGLSNETSGEVHKLLNDICFDPERFVQNPELLQTVSSVRLGFESALLDIQNGGRHILFSTAFTRGEKGIPINGLIWMGNPDFMHKQIREKIEQGFHCIKLKIGAIDFHEEWNILKSIRQEFPDRDITLRLDANGAYQFNDALEYMKRLSSLYIHSIEQPLQAGQWENMARLCETAPIPVALDEELIGIYYPAEKEKLMQIIRPQYLVLKPGLHGGLSGCNEWIQIAEKYHSDYWITSCLEANIGLNAIAQWTSAKSLTNEQGLGTGMLFTNNFESPLSVQGDQLWHDPDKMWNLDALIDV